MAAGGASVIDLADLAIVTTAACNLHCSYCCAGGRPGRSAPWPSVRAAIDALLASPASRVQVLFTGGEPLLEWPLVRRAVAYLETHRRRAQHIHYTLLSNGLLLGARTLGWLERHAFDVRLSLDGIREAQDARSTGTFDVLDALIRRIRQRSPAYFHKHVGVTMTLTPRAVGSLAESVNYLLDAGIATIRAAPAMDVPPGRGDPAAELWRQIDVVYRRSLEHFTATGEVPFVPFRRNPLVERRRGRAHTCGATTGRAMAVDADGEVSPCLLATRTYTDARPLPADVRMAVAAMRAGPAEGDVAAGLDEARRRVRRLPVFAAGGRRRSPYGACSRCRWRHECAICPLASVSTTGKDRAFLVPAFACAFNQATAACRAQFPMVIS